MAIFTNSARDAACIFSITRARWASTVLALTPSVSAISLLARPLVTISITSCSRGVRWASRAAISARSAWLEEHGYDEHSPERSKFNQRYREENPFPYADMDDLMAHFTHVIELVGIDYVGIGSDFDGVGDSLPEGMKDVSFYPNLVRRFLSLEFPVADIEKVLGGNLMRVWRRVELVAQR